MFKVLEEKTVCIKCAHHKHIIKNAAAPHVWYNHKCGASERPSDTNPVTGESGFVTFNDLGTQLITEDKYDFCRDVNNGYCSLFQPETIES